MAREGGPSTNLSYRFRTQVVDAPATAGHDDVRLLLAG